MNAIFKPQFPVSSQFIEQAIAKVSSMESLSYAQGVIDMAVELRAINYKQAGQYMQDARMVLDGMGNQVPYLGAAKARNKAEDDAFWDALMLPEPDYQPKPCPKLSLLQSHKA